MSEQKELALGRGPETTEYIQGSRVLQDLHGIEGDEPRKLAKAEYLYQKDECFEALVQVVSTIPVAEKNKDIWCLYEALTLEMMILVMSGQASSAEPLMKALKERVMAAGRDEVLEKNIDALAVWASMYDGSMETMNQWMKRCAPDEHTEFSLEDTFRYIVKLRCYLIQEKHMALLSLGERLKSGLKQLERPMDLCEINVLLAISCYVQRKLEQAFNYIGEALQVAEQYRYDRLIGDEGKQVYQLLLDYRKERGRTPYSDRVADIARRTGLLYPNYLKSQKTSGQNLSEGELKVLRLMKEELSNSEIAAYLDVSLNTVKFHSKNIYKKLEVNSRGQALKQARNLGIL